MPDNTYDLAQKAWHRRLEHLMDEMPELRNDIKWIKAAIEQLQTDSRDLLEKHGKLHHRIDSVKLEIEQQINRTKDAVDVNIRAVEAVSATKWNEIGEKITTHLSNHKLVYSLVLVIPTIISVIAAFIALAGGSG